jgi:hypothetical protein
LHRLHTFQKVFVFLRKCNVCDIGKITDYGVDVFMEWQAVEQCRIDCERFTLAKTEKSFEISSTNRSRWRCAVFATFLLE